MGSLHCCLSSSAGPQKPSASHTTAFWETVPGDCSKTSAKAIASAGLREDMKAELERLTAPDLEIFRHAQGLFETRAVAHGQAYEERLEVLTSPHHGKVCAGKIKTGLAERCRKK